MKAATAVIDCRALQHNLKQVRDRAPQSRLMAIVKANAYGHGLLKIAHTLKDADCYAVARISEALMLRSSGITKPVVLLEGFFSAEDLHVLMVNNIDTVVHSIEQLEALEQACLPTPVRVWMKLDTGMHRLGVRLDKADAFYQRLCTCQNVIQPVNLMSHLSCADEPEMDITLQQLSCFDAFIADKQGQKSIAASSGILIWPQSHYDWVRPGIMLYGVSPLPHLDSSHFHLQPVMELKSSLIAVREHHRGEPVGYGATWKSPVNTQLGVVAIGYGDGYPRSAPAGTPVWLNGRNVPIVGRVSMDMLCVDLGPEATDKVGDDVTLWGHQLPVEKIAAFTGISAYELVTKLTSRVVMEYIIK